MFKKFLYLFLSFHLILIILKIILLYSGYVMSSESNELVIGAKYRFPRN